MSDRGIIGMLATVFLLASVNGLGAGREDGPRPLGFLAGRGEVWVDKQPAPSGTSLFAGDVISTGKASVAVMNFTSGTAATLVEDSEVALSRSAHVASLSLRKGAMTLRNAGPGAARVEVLDSSVVVRGEAGFPALCRIAFVGRVAEIFADRGRIEIHSKGAPLILPSGGHARLEAGRPQAAGQQAGKVSNAIPEEVLQPQGQAKEIPLKVPDTVNYEDVVRTLKTGRVRIALLDGSFLNIGARSVMRITKHDPQSQQTEIELQLGRLRGEVVKITKPGGSFQVRTQTAVIGVVGTIFSVQALRTLTRVFCVDGTVTVRSIDPAIAGQVSLHAGQSTNIVRGVPPAGAGQSPVSQVVNEVSQTNAGETLSGELSQALQTLGATSAQVSAAGQAVGAAAGAGAQVGANAASAAAEAASAGLSGAAISRVGDAKDTLASASGNLQGAGQANDAAATAAAAAAESATNATVAVQELIQVLSPGAPGCGCLP